MKSAYIYEFVAGTSLMVAMYSVFVGIFFSHMEHMWNINPSKNRLITLSAVLQET